jgi:glycosyltransferase involved in cell wall biosynthesis
MPLFSIGIPTYDRTDSLKITLQSVLAQTFSDYEVIIGNDNTSRPLTPDVLGLEDRRVRIINRRKNLGELGNMNALLHEARGKFFTWQFDDDLYSRRYLEACNMCLEAEKTISCVYTSFEKAIGMLSVDCLNSTSLGRIEFMSGREFLAKYLSRQLRAMGCTGMFEMNTLRKLGGATKLSKSPFALYSEYLLLVQVGSFHKVAYVPEKLIYYVVHDKSWGNSNLEVEIYEEAGQNLLSSVNSFLTGFAPSERNRALEFFKKLVFQELVKKMTIESKSLSFKQSTQFLKTLTLGKVNNPRCLLLLRSMQWSIIPFLKGILKVILPGFLLRPFMKVHARLQ